jgi:MFS superfamily sulfate permease-like transporter
MISAPARFLPFLRWFPLSGAILRADLMAGITVAMVLVPQSMAYALLAGLPVVYGLYAALVPVVVGALFGHFNLLHTGPVVMMAMMSAAAIGPLALAGSSEFIALSALLALMVGVLRLLMGAFSLGALVNLVSHPVMVGFTNAMALVIGFSQLRFILDMPDPGSGSFLGDVGILVLHADHAYLPAAAFALVAGLMIGLLPRWLPKLPAVLLVVLCGTLISAATGYERLQRVDAALIADAETTQLLERVQASQEDLMRLSTTIKELRQQLQAGQTAKEDATVLEALRAEIHVLEVRSEYLKRENNARRMQLHAIPLQAVDGPTGRTYVRQEGASAFTSFTMETWRFRGIKEGQVTLSAGGSVIGKIPQGLPSFQPPAFDWNSMLALLPAALIMALIGFIEAASVSKALATQAHVRIDANKELIGQGLANIAGAFFQGFTVSGSFSRTAVAARSGARTGLYAVISALVVLLVLLYFTAYLYHLPQAVLAAIVMMAVFGLIRISPLLHAWKTQRSDAITGAITFCATLAFAPNIANGILIGAGLTAALFLMRTMTPRAAVIGRRADGSMGGIDVNDLEPIGRNFVAMRFDGSLNYLNVASFEDTVLEIMARFPQARGILVIASGINEIDASGEEKLRDLVLQLRKQGVTMLFSSLKTPVAAVFQRTGLVDVIGAENIFISKDVAIEATRERFDRVAD